MHYLYRITNQLNGKVYIGQSNKEKERWRQHKYFARQNAIQYIHRAMAKYGIDNFTYEVIAMCKAPEDADELEAILITWYDSRNKEKGYNISLGGDPAWNRGLPKEQQPMYGKKRSNYQKQRMKEVHTGRPNPHTDDWRKSVSQTLSGKAHSAEWHGKIVQSRRNGSHGYAHTKDDKKKMSQSHLGIHAGEKHPQAKLTWEIVRAMRKDYEDGMRQCDITKKYGVRKETVYQVVKYKNWIE